MTITENYFFNPSYNELLPSNTKNPLECDPSNSDLETKQKAADIFRKTALENTSTTHQEFSLDPFINSLSEDSLSEENSDLDSFINFLSEENSDNALDSLLNETDQTIISVSACQKALLSPLIDPTSIGIYSDHSYSKKLSEIKSVQAISSISAPKEVNKSSSKKNTYNLRYGPYRFSQEKSDLSPECEKQEIMNLLHSGVARAAIKNIYGISSKTLKEWQALSPWPGWNRKSRRKK